MIKRRQNGNSLALYLYNLSGRTPPYLPLNFTNGKNQSLEARYLMVVAHYFPHFGADSGD